MNAVNDTLGLIGHGAIGREITGALDRLGESGRLVATLVRRGVAAPQAVDEVEALIARRPAMVIECAGHDAVRAYGGAVLAAGIDLVISSVGVLADPAVAAELLAAERRGGGRLLLPPGAIAGLDGLVAAGLAGLDTLTYTSFKPPHAWAGTPAEDIIDLGHAEPEVQFFEGTARDAARLYPKNANVAVAVGLAGLGLDRTRVRLVSSRRVADPLGVIEAAGAFGSFRFEILGLASPANPKTSLLTAYSLLQCVRVGGALPVARLQF